MSERPGERRCEGLGERLSAFLDGELAPRDAEAMRAHLAGCARCRAELAAMSADETAVAAVVAEDRRATDPGERYWEDFPGRVRSRIAESGEPARARAWRGWLRVSFGLSPVQTAVAGGLAVAVLAVYLAVRHDQPLEPPGMMSRQNDAAPRQSEAVRTPAPDVGLSRRTAPAAEDSRAEVQSVAGEAATAPEADAVLGADASAAEGSAGSAAPEGELYQRAGRRDEAAFKISSIPVSPVERARATLDLLAVMEKEGEKDTAVLLPMFEELARQPLPDSLAAAVLEAIEKLGGEPPRE